MAVGCAWRIGRERNMFQSLRLAEVSRAQNKNQLRCRGTLYSDLKRNAAWFFCVKQKVCRGPKEER